MRMQKSTLWHVLDHVPELGSIDQWPGFREDLTGEPLVGIILLRGSRDSPVIVNFLLANSCHDGVRSLGYRGEVLTEKVIYGMLALPPDFVDSLRYRGTDLVAVSSRMRSMQSGSGDAFAPQDC